MGNQFTEQNHPVKGLDAVANAFAGTVYSDILKMSNFAHAVALIHKGVGASGTATITVEACDDAAGTNPVAIPFRYRAYIASDDAGGALTDALAAGFTTTAGSSQLYAVEVDSEALASLGKAWVRIKSVEVVASAVLGGIIWIMSAPRYGAPFETTIA